jgi:hypothetical protein
MEVFSLAHEYGHHFYKHEVMGLSSDRHSTHREEHQADLFARLVCLMIAINEDRRESMLAACVGAPAVLGMLELVERARSVLVNGHDTLPSRPSHPSTGERIKLINIFDHRPSPPAAWSEFKRDFPSFSEFASMRLAFLMVLDIVWEAVRPEFDRHHHEGVRPSNGERDPLDVSDPFGVRQHRDLADRRR